MRTLKDHEIEAVSGGLLGPILGGGNDSNDLLGGLLSTVTGLIGNVLSLVTGLVGGLLGGLLGGSSKNNS